MIHIFRGTWLEGNNGNTQEEIQTLNLQNDASLTTTIGSDVVVFLFPAKPIKAADKETGSMSSNHRQVESSGGISSKLSFDKLFNLKRGRFCGKNILKLAVDPVRYWGTLQTL